MYDILLKILEMSLMGSVVILVTILMRFLFKKSSKRYVMILWAIVALRLLVPVSIESAVSVFNLIPHKLMTVTAAEEPVKTPPTTKVVSAKAEVVPIASGIKVPMAKNESAATQAEIPAGAETVKADKAVNVAKVSEVKARKSVDWRNVLGITYVVGVAVIAGYCTTNYLLLKRKLRDAREIEKNVFESDKVNSPFVFGFVTPKIYLPDVLDKNEREYILMHERTHIRHGDWISKFVGIATVAVHWFNPLVWIGYSLFEQDVEMLCDEDTVSVMDKDLKKAYMMSIVSYAKKSRDKAYLVVPLSFSKPNFGKKEVTNRVKNMINYKKGTKITAILTTIVVFGVSTACALNSTTESKDETKTTTAATTAVTTVAETTAADTATTEADDVDEEFVDLYGDEDLDPAELEEYKRDMDNYMYSHSSEGRTYYYNLLMDKAAEIHNEDKSDSMIYGFYDVNFGGAYFYKLLTYDKSTGEYSGYEYNEETAKIESCKELLISYQDLNNTNPEEWLMPYDDFEAFPGASSFDLFGSAYLTKYDKDKYHSKFADGVYEGSIYGFTEDMEKAVVNLASIEPVDYTYDDFSKLDVGDKLIVNGKEETITNKYAGDLDENGTAIDLLYDDYYGLTANKVVNGEMEVIVGPLHFDTDSYTFAEVPIADNAVINFYNMFQDTYVTVTKDTCYDYLRSLENDYVTDGGIYEGKGFAFECTGYFPFLNQPVVIENGEIVEMTIEMQMHEKEWL